ncbi:MAG TPA: bacillithiol biosynthesis BshC [Gemmatimonadaceae bacterium]|nr:bacillithiol biosynthesis BshC [Gemmatimonadaceae bacterium]
MSEPLVPRVITEPVGGSALAGLAQRGEAPPGWYEPAPRDREGWLARARAIAAEGTAARTLRALGSALHARGAAAERIARVVRDGGIVVTTGQQPGLFGGPVYTWTKAIGAAAMAEALERATGISTAAVFWAATDDADALEASQTVIAVPGGAERLVAEVRAPAGTPMCAAPLGDVGPLFARLAESSGSALHSDALDVTRGAYHAGSTVGDAFVALLASFLNPLGVAVLDAGSPLVRELAAPVTTAALDRAPAVARALAERAAALRAAGFEPQVEEIDKLSLVFDWSGGVKTRVPVDALARSRPTELSPNVLLRPVVERALLPTVAYLAGPGELAYFAQVSAVASALDAAQPLAIARWSCTIVEPRVERALARLRLGLDDVRDGARAERIIAERAIPEAARRAIDAARRHAAALGEALAPLAADERLIDERVVAGHRRRAEWEAARLERRLLAAVKRRETEAMQQLGTVRGSLWPLGVRQERALNFIPLLARYGPPLLERMRAAAAEWARARIGE